MAKPLRPGQRFDRSLLLVRWLADELGGVMVSCLSASRMRRTLAPPARRRA